MQPLESRTNGHTEQGALGPKGRRAMGFPMSAILDV